MGLITNMTLWFKKGVVVDEEFITGWYNIEVLNGSQFYIQYENPEDFEVVMQLSPAEAHGRDGVNPEDCATEYEVLTGENAELGFFDPPIVLDRPAKSFRLAGEPDDDLGIMYFCLCANGAAG